ncbi:MAG: NAD(P)-binding domain-containing protein [Rubrivivax sp.]|nr:NAD(P)-binding domain-containing protein [Rubrivivax sp.]
MYGCVLLLALGLYLRWRQRRQRAYAAEMQQSLEAGLAEPPSLHPVVNPLACIGSGSCVSACPEGALGIVGGKAVLINGSACIGHGACQSACAFDAIQLVFGTERRGIDIPDVTPAFESNVPGVYIAGELGGMGLIRKAAEQGRQAIEHVRKRSGTGWDLDVVIVGCGPAGLSAGLACIEHGLRYRLLEQEDSLGGAVFHYPRAKIAMTAPVKLAVVGTVRFGEVAKEKLLEFWNDIVRKTGLRIEFRECLQHIEADGDGFVVHTQRNRYRTRSVLLAMGRRGTPRKLEVPGEDTPKVVYRLIDPSQYRGRRVLVVGGGDSALEAALALCAEAGTQVTLSYRGDAFSRVKAKNRVAVQEAQAAGRLRVLLGTQVRRIDADAVQIENDGHTEALPNDDVIVCAGGELPMPLLRKVGIRFQTHHGLPA